MPIHYIEVMPVSAKFLSFFQITAEMQWIRR